MTVVDQPPRVLCVGGLDPTGAAGLGADLKTLAALGIYGAPIATAVTVQNALSFRDSVPVPATIVGAQIDAAVEDVGMDVIKTGMLVSEDTVLAVADRVQRLGSACRLVIDPVTRSSTGRTLLGTEGKVALLEHLLPLAALVTPNVLEAEELTGVPIQSTEDMGLAADHLLALGASAVLVKGGHLPLSETEDGEGDDESLPEVVDLLRTADGDAYMISGPRIPGPGFRGTGCTLSAAIAGCLAEGRTLRAAVEDARDYLGRTMIRTIESQPELFRGKRPLALEHAAPERAPAESVLH